ncbi:unnamed protein product [Polarella glacialis]|uniref:Uncharacterized protein n=1 Tax=Polarella glacialis TaxID=89957 RepID=A0A813JNI2_POLGL|nr:unnamed protein product [Polarella glacialis]
MKHGFPAVEVEKVFFQHPTPHLKLVMIHFGPEVLTAPIPRGVYQKTVGPTTGPGARRKGTSRLQEQVPSTEAGASERQIPPTSLELLGSEALAGPVLRALYCRYHYLGRFFVRLAMTLERQQQQQQPPHQHQQQLQQQPQQQQQQHTNSSSSRDHTSSNINHRNSIPDNSNNNNTSSSNNNSSKSGHNNSNTNTRNISSSTSSNNNNRNNSSNNNNNNNDNNNSNNSNNSNSNKNPSASVARQSSEVAAVNNSELRRRVARGLCDAFDRRTAEAEEEDTFRLFLETLLAELPLADAMRLATDAAKEDLAESWSKAALSLAHRRCPDVYKVVLQRRKVEAQQLAAAAASEA